MMPESEKPKPFEKTYGLYLNAGDKRFTFKNTDNGITLTDWKLAWTARGQDDSAPLQNIASVHLQSGGDFKNPLNQCQITFRDGYVLTVHDGTTYGTADDAQTAVYRDFLYDLHTRLAMAPPGTIAFARGYSTGRYMVVKICAILLALMFVVLPLGLFVYTGEFKALMLLFVGIGFCWPIYRLMQANAPRAYDPRALPDELME